MRPIDVMESQRVKEDPQVGDGRTVPSRRGRRRAIALAGGIVVVAVAIVVAFVVSRKPPLGPPGWVVAPAQAAATAGEVEGNARRLIEREGTVLVAAAERAGRVPGLATLLTASLDGAAFQDALASEPWWKEFRGYGCAVLIGDGVKAVWQLPGSGLSPAELASAVASRAADAPTGARVVSGPNGVVLAAMAPIVGAKDARLVLAEALDRRKVALLAARANAVLMLSDGRKDLGASVPDDSVPLVESLIGMEPSHALVERHLQQLAVAVPWSGASGLWLWVITGWQP